ncbi:MAG TPA: AAA family ATPase [Cyanobacteria bacterium UBA12227]|nr:AAA family ATPase [Cyanobacteria bacterium UBA12227]HAX85873.1 AAA family ATPase [Cyanobacteria bacterium UBA11370]HBY75839.1 AAA family ATPase [Cyanobacteria bacterium UBA11148]
MSSGYFGNEQNNLHHKIRSQGLLGAGWRPLSRQFDWSFFWHLVNNDSWELAQKTLDIASDIADTLGRHNYNLFANVLGLFSDNMRYEMDEFWGYITPDPPAPNHHEGEVMTVDTPVTKLATRDSIPIEYVLNRLEEVTLFKVLNLLGNPTLITQNYAERQFYYPTNRFVNWERLDVLGTVYVYWSNYQVWLQIDSHGKGRRRYSLIANNIRSLVNKATYNVAVMLSGYQSRVGQVYSQFVIRQFPADIQSFTDTVQQAILDENRLAVLVHGEPGTGKTAWTQAVAKEVLVPLGYVIFILDHDAVENFVPPSYLERIAIIINEADNLAQDRASEIAQQSNKTEHILSLLDGTLYQSVVEEGGIKVQQKLVVLMTCNTTERLDPAMLRKGRVDLTYKFTHRFV